MGIYTSGKYFNEAYDYASEIPANEAYDAAFGCAHILADCQANDMALFESAVYSDMNEVMAMHEGTTYVNENAFTDVLKKIVEMFKKLLAKIKGIFAAFLAKLRGAFKDGKELVKKYEKQIIKYGNWKGFKCKKIRVPKDDNIITAINTLFKYDEKSAGINTNMYKIYTRTHTDCFDVSIEKIFGTLDADKIKEMDTEDIKEKLLAFYTTKNFNDISNFNNDVLDELYDEEDTIDEDTIKESSSYFSKAWIKGVLNESEKWEKDVKKFNEKLEKNINTIIDNINKADDDLAKWIKDNPNTTIAHNNINDHKFAEKDDNGKIKKSSGYTFKDGNNQTSTESVQKTIHVLQKLANNDQEVITKVTSEYMAQVKFAISQARKVWTAAAAWSSGVHKESVEYVNALAECAAEQLYTNMEAIH